MKLRLALGALVTMALSLPFSDSRGQARTTGALHGAVVTAQGMPIVNALVEILSSGDSTRTSTQGEFDLARTVADSAQLRIRAIGFKERITWIRVRKETNWLGTFFLDRSPLTLPGVTVRAERPEFEYTSKYDDFFRRRRVGSGTYRTQEDFAKIGATDLVSGLRNIPGVSVSLTSSPYGAPEVRFRMARCPGASPNIAIYINGQRVPLFAKKSENRGSELTGLSGGRKDTVKSSCEDCTRLAEVMSSIALSDILFMEFYRGPGQIPADLDRGDSCAALVVWTR